jgi:DNA-binding transcriptional regulator YhcF (GntR family)
VHEDAVRFLSRPVEAQPGTPLRVAVYSRIAQAVGNNLLTPGSMLPTETDLGSDMKVSRTVVRVALMLLEEDGLIRARRGVGRFVSDTLPRIGIERIRPFEEVLGGPGHQIEIKRIQVERQPASEFVAPGVGVDPGSGSGSGSPSSSETANPSRTYRRTSPRSLSAWSAAPPRLWTSRTTAAPSCSRPSTKRRAGGSARRVPNRAKPGRA